MTQQRRSSSKYIRHNNNFKAEALKLTTQSSVAQAARDLGLHESQAKTNRACCHNQ